MCLQEEKLVLQQSFDGKEILLRAADCLLVCFLLSVFKAQRLSFLIIAAVQCRSLFMLSLFLLIINVGCQKTVKPFVPLSVEEKSSLLSLGHTTLNTTISGLHTETFKTTNNLRHPFLFNNKSG